eukprot:COSAG06_NODE_66409_length_254_cov_0.974194_1_plen_31_part_10
MYIHNHMASCEVQVVRRGRGGAGRQQYILTC